MARDFTRSDRVGRQMQRELADLLRSAVKDPRLGAVTVQEVRVSRDLSYAKVYFTLFDDSDRKEQTRLLNESASFLRREIGHRMKLRVTPELRFQFDDSVEQGARLTDLIQKAVADDGQAQE
ncbi:MAG: 30S ribosome-binding factor RbfA [Gammaproteobacteria bacterium]|nr:30S ribosome-binding factor RbfA [Gammaproteobacteria bacterium]MBU1655464.1 30S ribosome-binding factor RbfA [Gammaproteobacteria bacterium]MBU1962431.1 30S ribosome-binding factor RbfA [Gammaproteobacteria bacterium]